MKSHKSDSKKQAIQIYSLCRSLLDTYGNDEAELDEMAGVNDVIDEAASFVNAFENSILFFDVFSDIRQKAYKKYQHDWMISHGIGEDALNKVIQEYVADTKEDCPEMAFSEWLFEHGFDGSIWVCYDEFLGTEYQDKEYMVYLLTEDEYALYKADLKNF